MTTIKAGKWYIDALTTDKKTKTWYFVLAVIDSEVQVIQHIIRTNFKGDELRELIIEKDDYSLEALKHIKEAGEVDIEDLTKWIKSYAKLLCV